MVDHLDVLRSESQRFLAALSRADPAGQVPTCPGWTAADLAWHLAEVQSFWASVVETRSEDPQRELDPPPRPDDHDRLLTLVEQAGRRLVSVLERTPADATCWSWHEDGGTVGWVARRQAHEALIHRVDAEQCAGLPVQEPDAELARDGVDEVLTVMIAGTPRWGRFTPDGDRVRIATTDTPGSWTLALGRFTGTSPGGDRTYDLDAAQVDGEEPPVEPRAGIAAIAGRAWDLDRWLWGRATTAAFDIRGEGRLVERLRLLAAEATQ